MTGPELAAVILRLGHTQGEAAARLGLHRITLNRQLRGHTPSPDPSLPPSRPCRETWDGFARQVQSIGATILSVLGPSTSERALTLPR